MTYEALNAQISKTLANQGDLTPLKEQWSTHLQKTSDFIDMFLERFGGRVLGDRDTSPEWKLYLTKTEEYNNYARAIRNLDYFIAKSKYAA
jgi:hypothetical protein